MMDISDGLAQDLPRLAAASGCGFVIDHSAIPRTPGSTRAQALGDGEDFEMLLAIEPVRVAGLLAGWQADFPELPLTRIGELVASGAGESLTGGWDHFSGH